MSLITELPPGLNTAEFAPILVRTATQWSRLIAWSWTDYLVFSSSRENADKERELKKLLIQTLKQQALYAGAFIAYGNFESQARAEELSNDIENLMLGNNSAVSRARENNIELTLSQVIQESTGEPLATTQYQSFTRRFYYQVIVDKFVGGFEEIPEDRRTSSGKQYISYIPYPPRPQLSELTVTEQQLVAWASNSAPGSNYLPPSPYMVLFGP